VIIVRIFGGLGNQMFQYAFARQIESFLEQPLLLDISGMKDTFRKYSLDNFILKSDIQIDSSGKYNRYYVPKANLLLRMGRRFCPDYLYRVASRHGVHIWDQGPYRDVKIAKHKNVFLYGYWQSELYFQKIKSEIKQEFRFMREPLMKNKPILAKIEKEDSVCVHVRRTDFLSVQNTLCNCNNDYYLKAMQYLERYIKSPVYYIFSDDMMDVKNNFSFGNRSIIFVEQNNPDYEELRLMSHCKYFIIANSTFSWWASYLATYKNKMVIAPRLWYNDGIDEENVKRKDMILLDNDSQ